MKFNGFSKFKDLKTDWCNSVSRTATDVSEFFIGSSEGLRTRTIRAFQAALLSLTVSVSTAAIAAIIIDNQQNEIDEINAILIKNGLKPDPNVIPKNQTNNLDFTPR